MRYTIVCLIFFVYICCMTENKLTYVDTVHTAHDVTDYYICMNKRIVMEKVHREYGTLGYYTHTFVEFFSNPNNPKNIVDKISEIQTNRNEHK